MVKGKILFDKKLLEKIDLLPETFGVYQYYDQHDNLIYVGKAKNIKKRVRSYFVKRHESNKTSVLVKKINDIKFIEVANESDALLLENNLIKRYQPRYNILLKDDKTYPWICIRKERFPRVFFTRNKAKDNSNYFGPYTSMYMVKTLLDLIRQIYKIRNCNYLLSEENIKKNKFRACLEFQIGNCAAPCIGNQSEEDYMSGIDGVSNILKGNIFGVKNYLKDLMLKLAAEQKYELANEVKGKIEIIEKYQNKSVIVSPDNNNIDVYSIVNDEKHAFVSFLKVVGGAVVQFQNIAIRKKLNESDEELLPMAIVEIRNRVSSDSNCIVIPFNIDYKIDGIKFVIPKQGDKLKLLQLSQRNAKIYMAEQRRIQEKTNPKNRTARLLERMKSDLKLSELPSRIECFDNSNIQGAFPVAACVVFENAKPKKSEYRHFNIKTVIGPNDFATMEEVIYRRYKRLIDENKDLPKLLIVDGGKGQLSSAVISLEKLGLIGRIPVIGIAKRLEEIYKPGESLPIYIEKKSETLKVIQHMRDEAHRFGITFHKNKRSKAFLRSELENINGIGEKTINTLLFKFKTVENIRKIEKSELIAAIGESRANIISSYFSNF